MTIAALGGALVGQFHGGTSRTMVMAIGLAGVLSLLAFIGLVRPAAVKGAPADCRQG